MATTAYNLHLKGYVGGADFDSIMGHLSYYFDYEKYGRDLECDYTLEDGYVFRTCRLIPLSLSPQSRSQGRPSLC